MALRHPVATPDPEPDPEEALYDEAVADSFPASDPPAGVIKVGPRHPMPQRSGCKGEGPAPLRKP